jgi:hypothetical protein
MSRAASPVASLPAASPSALTPTQQLLTAATAGFASFNASHTVSIRSPVEVSVGADATSDVCPLAELIGLQHLITQWATITISNVVVHVARPAKIDVDVFVSIIDADLQLPTLNSSVDHARVARWAAILGTTSTLVIRGSNTAVDVFSAPGVFPPGVSNSLRGIMPPFARPGLLLAFADSKQRKDCELRAWITADVSVSGFLAIPPI